MADDFLRTQLTKPPMGMEQVLAAYGDIRKFIRSDGHVSPEWERRTLTTIGLHGSIPLGWNALQSVSTIRCHVRLVDRFSAVFQAIHDAGLWSQLRTFDGVYAFRVQRGSATKLSLHSFGAAIDLNAATNEMRSVGDMHPGVVQCFEAQGFTWGGRFVRSDPMHFQYASGV